MSAFDVMQRIAFNWGVRCFGREHMTNPAIRALRLAEEAVELAQCLNVPMDTMHTLIDTVYKRPQGSAIQEIGGVLVTTSVMCELMQNSAEILFETELLRCLSKSPEHFAKRNEEKLQLGLDAFSSEQMWPEQSSQ